MACAPTGVAVVSAVPHRRRCCGGATPARVFVLVSAACVAHVSAFWAWGWAWMRRGLSGVDVARHHGYPRALFLPTASLASPPDPAIVPQPPEGDAPRVLSSTVALHVPAVLSVVSAWTVGGEGCVPRAWAPILGAWKACTARFRCWFAVVCCTDFVAVVCSSAELRKCAVEALAAVFSRVVEEPSWPGLPRPRSMSAPVMWLRCCCFLHPGGACDLVCWWW